jgi:hypothetical protein
VSFFSNLDIPIAYELLSCVQNFSVEPNLSLKRSTTSTGKPISPFARALNDNALYMVFHREVNGKSTDLSALYCTRKAR